MKRFRKEIWTKFILALKRYNLVEEGDKIAVCVSGGKDSMILSKLMQIVKDTIKKISIKLKKMPNFWKSHWRFLKATFSIVFSTLKSRLAIFVQE